MSDRKTLHPFQLQTIQSLGAAYLRGHRRIVCSLPTGGGKSVIQTHMAFSHLSKAGCKGVLITAPRTELVRQTHKQLADHGVRHVGIIRGGIKAQPIMPVQVATIQALARRKVPNASLVLVDECHLRSELLERLMADPAWADVTWVGFSATPWRKGMAKHWDDLVIGATTKQLIGDGYLVPFETFASQERPDLSNVHTVQTAWGRDYHEGELAVAMNKPKLVADIVDTWQQLGRGSRTITFCVNRAHARVVHEAYCEAGVHAAYMDCDTPDDERDAIKAQLEKGELEVVVNVGVLSVGSDWPFVDLIQLARPTKSEMWYAQAIGRGLRTHPAKSVLRILDHTDAWDRLGPVDEIHHTELDDGTGAKTAPRPKPEEAKPKECPKCHFIKPVKTPVCPKCGFHTQVQPKVITVNGKLEKVTRSKKSTATQAEKQAWYSGLLFYAQQRAWKRGWAFHKFCEKFDMRGLPPKIHNIPMEPTPEMLAWIKGQMARRHIAYQHRQEVRP